MAPAAGLAAIALVAALGSVAAAQDSGSVLARAQHHFYSGQYTEAAALAAQPESTGDALAALELRTSALHFQLKRLIGHADNKGRAYRQCQPCAGLFEAFMADLSAGKALAKARLASAPDDEAALFFLGKLNLNYVWLQLSTLDRRTGWGEYREARRSIDAVLRKNPSHVRATVAKAWIEYIVDTRVPFLLQWTLGGGSRKKALEMMRTAATADAERYAAAEADFGLWEMLGREKRIDEALDVARKLSAEFPDNEELRRFIAERREPLR